MQNVVQTGNMENRRVDERILKQILETEYEVVKWIELAKDVV